MSIIKQTSDLMVQESAIKLPRYAQIIEYSECMFFGVQTTNEDKWACRTYWAKTERDSVARYLAEAQEEIENVINYKMSKTWVVDERQPFRATGLVHTRWTKLLAIGTKATTTIQAGATVNHASDPAIVGPIATTVTDEDEIIVYQPGTDVEIFPSDITISGGFVTIEIPRCRLVATAYVDNDPDRPYDYSDTTVTGPFTQTVDVKRVYNSTSTQGKVYFADGTSDNVDLKIQDAETGLIAIADSTCSSSSGCIALPNYCSSCPVEIGLNYKCGVDLTRQMEDTIVRLAHSKMPVEPCGCDITQRLWARDRNVPDVLTRERINCPFGLSDGAWIAYKFATTYKTLRSLGNLM